ncbi:MAG: hypothetical protein DME22_25655 [Verrucomicrobia bacterium]|nr:MAG: hypothetical protein DME22_25655 [Verrucomicrobiota bacterium]
MWQMSDKNVVSRESIDLRVCATGGLGKVIYMVVLWCAAFVIPQCNALSIRDALGAIFWDKNEAWRVVEQVLAARVDAYRRYTGHTPGAFDIYVLWNAPGQFHRVGYQQKRISRVVAERAMRFTNLVRRAESPTMVAANPKLEKGLLLADRGLPQFALAVNGMD